MVRFRILGPVEFWTGQAWAGIGAPKWRSLLAALLINAGQVVSTDRLIEEIWGDSPPAGATNLVSIYALRLRRLVGDEPGEVLRTRAPGYQMTLGPEDLDAAQFDALVREARQALGAHKPDLAAELLTEALALWQGRALIDVRPSPLIVAETERLEAAQLDALELRIEADIGCDRQPEVIPELFRLVADHPLREGFWGLLMQALDGAGRHAEALTAYQRAREVIADELGVDPGEQLQGLYQEILTRDTRQQGNRAGRKAGPGTGEPRPAPPGQRPAGPPRQLPADISDFTGRDRDLRRLYELQPRGEDDDRPGAVMVALVIGAGGLGKTTLAIHAAHRLRHRFPDGQLYVNLLGATGQPLAPGGVLARFLRDLGVHDEQIPDEEDERAALLRTRLTGKQMLVLLDNAKDTAQVRPLLPGSSSCAVMVTTRQSMPDLVATQTVNLDVLDEDEALALFGSIVGAERVDVEAKATQEVLAACAGLPLAIRIAGARLAARRSWTVRALADRLRSQQRRLDELQAGDLAVRASFEVSIASLPRRTAADGITPAQAFGFLGLWQGPAIGLTAAAALFGQADAATADALEQLVDAHLLESPGPDLYRFHDLLRVYAAERSNKEPEQARQEAERRILTWYLHTAEAAAKFISPNHTGVPLGPAEPGIRPLKFTSLDEVLEWCEAERASLVAATRQAAASGLHEIAWQLPAATMSFFYRRSHWADWITTHEIGLRSARRLGDRRAEAWMLNNLGMAYGLRRAEQAVDYGEQALAIYREIGDRPGELRVSANLSTTYFQLGRFQEALDTAQRSLTLQRDAGKRYGEGLTLGTMGCAYRELGGYDDAIRCHQEALVIFRELGDKDAEADSLSELGRSYLGLERVDDALSCLGESLGIWRETGDRYGQATTLKLLGRAWQLAGHPEQANGSIAQAQRIFDELEEHDQAATGRADQEELARRRGGGDAAKDAF